MRQALTLLLLLAAAPVWAAEPTITPPQQVAYAPGKLLKVSVSGVKDVSFVAVAIPDAVVDEEVSGTTLVLGMPAEGTVVLVLAATVDAGGKPVALKTSITVGKKGAGPTDPPVKGAVKNATLVTGGPPAAEVAALLEAARAGAADRGVKLRILNLKDPAAAAIAAGFQGFYDTAKGPCIVLQDAGKGRNSVIVTSSGNSLIFGVPLRGAIA